jgi:negative modulator of initiation of replication
MRSIEIDNEVYEALLSKVHEFGGTPNSVLRREFNIGGPGNTESIGKKPSLNVFLHSTEFKFSKGAVGRFLTILSWLYKQHSEEFPLVEGIRGRGRLYFSKSVEELERSGKSVNPKKIPETPYWVITTTSTDLKKDILGQVMKALDYELESINFVKRAIG